MDMRKVKTAYGLFMAHKPLKKEKEIPPEALRPRKDAKSNAIRKSRA